MQQAFLFSGSGLSSATSPSISSHRWVSNCQEQASISVRSCYGPVHLESPPGNRPGKPAFWSGPNSPC